MSSIESKTTYHHGDLCQSLVAAATDMIQEQGIEGLSLRKLAERVGVSRTAPYHHFKDKNELLCAIATEGFKTNTKHMAKVADNESLSAEQQLRAFAHGYIQFACENPEIYELMFGRTIWKQGEGTEELKRVAYPNFQQQVEATRQWQKMGILDPSENALRLSQVLWGTLHGIAKLAIDGIYIDSAQIEEMCDCAVNQFIGFSENK